MTFSLRLFPARLLILLTLLLAACGTVTPPQKPATDPGDKTPKTGVGARFKEADWSALPGWPGEQLGQGWQAWLQSCKKLGNRPGWQAPCKEAQAIPANDSEAMRRFLENRLQPWRIETSDGAGSGLVTGYYEPLLRGGRNPQPGWVPVYGVPDDLLSLEMADLYPETKGIRMRGRLAGNKVLPYWSRADIEAGKAPLAGRELAWVDDPVELFFLQIQGSGRIRLAEGGMLRVGYADQNGHPYKSIGKWLIDQGELKPEEASMQGIQGWIRKHPDALQRLLNTNPSYVFFRTLPSSEGGPPGAMNVPLTDGASVAVDSRHIPLGSPLFLATTWPNDSRPLQRFVQAQDTGGAIRGPLRVDYFWGFGAEAGQLAGRMKQSGQLWLLWPKGLTLPVVADAAGG